MHTFHEYPFLFWNTIIGAIFAIIYHFGEKVKLILSSSMVCILSQCIASFGNGHTAKGHNGLITSV